MKHSSLVSDKVIRVRNFLREETTYLTPNFSRIKKKLKHKTVKTNDKIRGFGIVNHIIQENGNKIVQITAFKAILARKLT